MNESVTITLPLPSKYLSPNYKPYSKGGAIAKSRATRSYRATARQATTDLGVESGPWQLVNVTTTFFHKVNRRRDGINHMQMLKAAFDGIVDSGLVMDDDSNHWKDLVPIFDIDEDWPRVEIAIERIN